MGSVRTTTLRPIFYAAFVVVTSFLLGSDSVATEADFSARLAAADRPEADEARDAGRKPATIIEFLGIAPGMQVIDLIAAGGYYTEVLSVAVGAAGTVYAQNPQSVLEMRDGANDKALTERLAADRLPNVDRRDQAFAELDLEPGSIDAALTALNFHDVYNAYGAEAADALLARAFSLLKPGGVLGIIDHSGGVGDDGELHRIDQAIVESRALAAGFEIAARSDALRNPADDRTVFVFSPELRGNTDRFVLRLRKAESKTQSQADPQADPQG